MKTTFLFIGIISSLVSCDMKEENQTININDQYSLELPSHMSKASNLNEEASLQYQNILKELYVIVIDEPKKEVDGYLESSYKTTGLASYAQLLHDNFKQALEKPKFSEVQNSQINGLKAQMFSASGIVETYGIYYEMAYIEGNHSYYQVLVWTAEGQKEKYAQQMKDIIATFKETKKRNAKKRLPK